jgi:hypothetical protein
MNELKDWPTADRAGSLATERHCLRSDECWG